MGRKSRREEKKTGKGKKGGKRNGKKYITERVGKVGGRERETGQGEKMEPCGGKARAGKYLLRGRGTKWTKITELNPGKAIVYSLKAHVREEDTRHTHTEV